MELTETRVNINVNSELLDEYVDICVAYRCKECTYVSTDRKTFYEHCLKHFIRNRASNYTTVYLCSQCYKAFNSFQETKKHMEDAHNEVKNEEQITPALHVNVEKTSDESKGKVKYKMREKENLACPRRGCKISFKKENDLEVHGKCHIDGDLKTLCCFECSILFPSWPKCAMHLYKVHQIDCGLLKCALCESYRTWAPLSLENHMRVHSDLRAFVCKTCGSAFKQASQLRNHNAIHSQVVDLPTRNKWKQCTMCFKMYSDAKTLKKHKVEVHSKLRPFVCNVCGHASARKSLLILHQRQHTGHKVHICYLCHYKTADHNSLRRHLMRHTGVRPYHCPECDFSTIRSSSFKLHVKQMHPSSTHFFSCVKCPYKTVSEDRYTRHVSDHLTGLIKDAEPDGSEGQQRVLVQLAQEFPAWVPLVNTSIQKNSSKTDPKTTPEIIHET